MYNLLRMLDLESLIIKVHYNDNHTHILEIPSSRLKKKTKTYVTICCNNCFFVARSHSRRWEEVCG